MDKGAWPRNIIQQIEFTKLQYEYTKLQIQISQFTMKKSYLEKA